MKHPFTGLYYYCRDLALNLEKFHADKYDFYFFSYPKIKLPKHLKRIIRNHFDKYYLIKPKKYKVWHSTWQDTKYVPKNDIKFVYTIHDLNFLYTDKSQEKKDRLLSAVQEKINRADAITVISHFVKQDIEKNLDLKGKEVHVIHNGVDFEEYPDFDNPSYRPKKKYLFTIGTVLYKKHFHVLPSLLVDNDYELIIAGIHPDKSYIKQIEDEIKKYDVADRVHLAGSVTSEEKYWYMKNAEAFVFPSISEGFGLPPIEAMRLGKPTFLSTLTSLPEIGGEHAYYFKSFKPEEMRKVLDEGLDDYYKNDKKEAIIKWSNQFNWEKASKEYVAVYEKAIQSSVNYSKKELTKVTAIIPTFNEEQNIKEVIKSLDFADEIIIIDSNSTDNTITIAKELGAKVIQREFDDYSSQKNYAISQAKNDWIFIIDADERISPKLKKQLLEVLSKPFEKDAYWIYRENYFSNKRIYFSGWQNDKVIRLFNRKTAKYNGKLVHEEINTEGKIGVLKGKLSHYTCIDKASYKEKIASYSILKARELFNEKAKPNFFHLYLKPVYRFLYHYVYKLGFLDGKNGYTIASLNAYGIKRRFLELKKLYQE